MSPVAHPLRQQLRAFLRSRYLPVGRCVVVGAGVQSRLDDCGYGE